MINNGIFLILLIVAVCYGERHLTLITFDTGSPNNSPLNSLTVRTNVTDFQSFGPGISTVTKKICVTGLWIIYNEANYKGKATSYPRDNQWSKEICQDVNTVIFPYSQKIGSARQVGPEESGLTLFSEIQFEGDVFKVQGPADAHLPFIPRSLLITGTKESWTLYTGTNFNGTLVYAVNTASSRSTYAKVYELDEDVKSIINGYYKKY